MITALVSALTRIPVRKDVAMTGEITLRGKVLPIGGLKEKMLAAIRMGVKTIIIPDLNKKDLADIPRHILKKVKVVAAKSIDDVLKASLVKFPPAPPLHGKNSSAKGKAVTRRVLVTPGKGVVAGAKN